MSYVKVSSKYQITLPKSVREALGVKAGDKLYVTYEGDKLILRIFRRIENPTNVLYGSVKSQKDAVEAIRAFRAVGGSA